MVTPGVYDLPLADYLADPVPGGSLSSTGARKLLPPSCPARYRWWADNPKPPKREFDLGHAAHRLVLGAGHELVDVDAANYRTKAAQEARDNAYAAGKVPLLPHEREQVTAMAAALREHPWAGRLFEPGTGKPEQTLVWQDLQTGVWCRALLDWLPNANGHRFILRDYKTAASAAPTKLDRAIADYSYHVQLAFHLMGGRALGLAGEDAQALLVAQEKDPPYLVTVVQPDPPAMRIGARQAGEALSVYAECVANGRWPGYSDDIELISLPPWVERQYEEVW